MLKAICKNLVWMALPLGLAVGCAENRPQAEAVYSPAPNVVLQPTSAEPEQRIYTSTTTTTTDSQVPGTGATVTAAPAGASAENWVVAEEIREKLISDKSMAPLGSTLIAEVSKDGVVTLRGNVSSPSEQQRVCDSISTLPGVRGVNNELAVGRFNGGGNINLR